MAITLTADQFKERYGQEGLDMFQVPTESLAPEKTSFFQRAGERFQDIVGRKTEKITDIAEADIAGEQTRLRSGFQAAGSLLSGGAELVFGTLIDAAIPEIIAEPMKKRTQQILDTPIGQKGVQALQSGVEAFDSFAEKNPRMARDIESLAGFLELVPGVNVASGVARGSAKGAAFVAKGTGRLAKAGGIRSLQAGGDLARATGKLPGFLVGKIPDRLTDKVAKFLSVDPDEKVVRILNEVPQSKLDEFLKIGEEASVNERALTAFDKVGDKMQDSLVQIDNRMSSIGAQKSSILKKARTGLVEFKDPVRRAILEMNKLGDKKIVSNFIDKLKPVKTKLDTDRVIDELQDALYTGGIDKTIVKGSRTEKSLKRIVGTLNTELKDSLPPSYSDLNRKFSELKNASNVLNTALGQTLEGVALSGGSLIKRFFSPNSRKTKELFEFIKRETNIDLVQDTVLAKFVMDLFDDPRARALLEGIPKSKSGFVDAIIDFAVEKTGTGKAVQGSLRKGQIERARSFTEQAPDLPTL